MNITVLHPEFKAVGGAELLVATHVQLFKSQSHHVRLLTFEFDPKTWSDRFGPLELETMPEPSLLERASTLIRGKFPRRASWLKRRLTGDDVFLAYNYPTNALLGEDGVGERRVWHCCEPPRWLHPLETNPAATERALRGPLVAQEHLTSKFRRDLARWTVQRFTGGHLARERQYDLDAVRKIPHVWALSEFGRDCIQRVYGRSDGQVVYPLVRFPRRATPQRAGVQRGGLGVLCHSRLEVAKNVDTVLRGFARFLQTPSGRGAHLHIVGTGSWQKRLQALASELRLTGAVTFHGFLPEADLERVYASCDVLACLPVDEPFGMIFPEAAARGLLVIGPNQGGPREILDDGRLGWAVPPFDPEALSAALEQVAHLTDSEAERRREEADRGMRDRFSAAAIGPRLQELLARV